jgi:hypothetical protein
LNEIKQPSFWGPKAPHCTTMQLVIRQAAVSLGAEAGHLDMVCCPPGCICANEWVIGHLVTLLDPLKTLRGRMTSCDVCDVFADTLGIQARCLALLDGGVQMAIFVANAGQHRAWLREAAGAVCRQLGHAVSLVDRCLQTRIGSVGWRCAVIATGRRPRGLLRGVASTGALHETLRSCVSLQAS